MSNDKERIVEKIQKLMRMAEDRGASETEMETAMRQAQKMLLKHNISMEDVKASGGQSTEPVIDEKIIFRNRPWVRTVMGAIAQLYYCKYIVHMYDKRTKTRHMFVGRESNVKTASLMAGFIVSAILANAKKERRAEGKGSAFESSFCLGASYRIAIRVDDMRKQPETSTGKGLMVINTTDQENADYVSIHVGKTSLVKSGSRGISDDSGYAQGDNYGKKVGLNTQLEKEKDTCLPNK